MSNSIEELKDEVNDKLRMIDDMSNSSRELRKAAEV
jgi:hypothetical protein